MDVPQVNPGDLATRLADGEDGLVLLDVREPEELRTAALEGVLHVPMGEIPKVVGDLDRDRTYVVVCHHGTRSNLVARFLRAQGLPRVENLVGGIDRWSQEVDPSIPRYR